MGDLILTSDETTKVYGKIAAVMRDVAYLKKDGRVSTGKDKSFSAITEEKVTSVIGEAMRKHGLVIHPIKQTSEHREFTETRERYGKEVEIISRYVIVDVIYRVVDAESGQFVTVQSTGTGVDSQDKAVGKAMTYAYKYALLRTFAIATGDDPDIVEPEAVAAPPPTSKKKEQAKSDPVKKQTNDDPLRLMTTEEIGALMTLAQDEFGPDGKLVWRDMLRQFKHRESREMTAINGAAYKAYIVNWRPRTNEQTMYIDSLVDMLPDPGAFES